MADVLMALLLVAAVFAGALGLMFTSEATLGVGVIALGCLCAILARIAQAGRHHNELMAPRREAQAAQTVAARTPEQLEHRAKVQRWQGIAAVAGLAAIGAIFVIGFIVSRIGAQPPETLTAEKAQESGALTVKVEEKSDAWWVENQTDYLWNVCWAERMGQRAIVPTMNPKATVAVRHDAFMKIGSAHHGSDLRVACSYDGTDVASPLTIAAVVKP
jgi:hypothetical protein